MQPSHLWLHTDPFSPPLHNGPSPTTWPSMGMWHHSPNITPSPSIDTLNPFYTFSAFTQAINRLLTIMAAFQTNNSLLPLASPQFYPIIPKLHSPPTNNDHPLSQNQPTSNISGVSPFKPLIEPTQTECPSPHMPSVSALTLIKAWLSTAIKTTCGTTGMKPSSNKLITLIAKSINQ